MLFVDPVPWSTKILLAGHPLIAVMTAVAASARELLSQHPASALAGGALGAAASGTVLWMSRGVASQNRTDDPLKHRGRALRESLAAQDGPFAPDRDRRRRSSGCAPVVVLGKYEAFACCEALAAAESALLRCGHPVEAASLATVFEMVEGRLVLASGGPRRPERREQELEASG